MIVDPRLDSGILLINDTLTDGMLMLRHGSPCRTFLSYSYIKCDGPALQGLLNMQAGQHLDSRGGRPPCTRSSLLTRCHLLPGKAH